MNTLLAAELNQMRHEELMAEAERVRLVRRAQSGAGAGGRASIVRRLVLSLKEVAQRQVVRRVLSPAANG
jgi:hypothetical protein